MNRNVKHKIIENFHIKIQINFIKSKLKLHEQQDNKSLFLNFEVLRNTALPKLDAYFMNVNLNNADLPYRVQNVTHSIKLIENFATKLDLTRSGYPYS